MARYEAVIFDLDGTLLNTLQDLADAVNYALGQMGWPGRSVDQVRQFVGNGVKLLIDRAAPTAADEEARAACLALFKDYYAAHAQCCTAPYEGILPLLRALKGEGIRAAVVSNKFDPAVKALAADYFPGLLDAAMGENEAGGVPKKPHPAMVLAALKALEVPPDRAVYVGDSDVDVDTAQNAGIPCLSVTWGFRDRAFLLSHGAAVLADTPEELLELIMGS